MTINQKDLHKSPGYVLLPCEKEYTFKPRLVVKPFSFEDAQSTETKLVTERIPFLLMDDHSTQEMYCQMAWTPDTAGEYHELSIFIKHPLNTPCRVSIHRKGDPLHGITDYNYFFIMSPGVALELVKLHDARGFFSSKRIEIMTYSEHDEHMSDGAIKADIVTNRKRLSIYDKYDK